MDNTHLRLVQESDEGCPFDLDWLSDFVIQTDHEVKEVGLAKIGRRLFREIDPPNSNAVKKIIF